MTTKKCQIIASFQKNNEVKIIAKEVGCTPQYVRQVLKKEKLHAPTKQERVISVVEKISETSDFNISSVASITGFQPKTVRKAIGGKYMKVFDGEKYRNILTRNFKPKDISEVNIERFIELMKYSKDKKSIMTYLQIDEETYENILKSTDYEKKRKSWEDSHTMTEDEKIELLLMGEEWELCELDLAFPELFRNEPMHYVNKKSNLTLDNLRTHDIICD